MGPVFADTFYWIALTNVKDAAHEQAKAFSRSSSLSSIVTTELARISDLAPLTARVYTLTRRSATISPPERGGG